MKTGGHLEARGTLPLSLRSQTINRSAISALWMLRQTGNTLAFLPENAHSETDRDQVYFSDSEIITELMNLSQEGQRFKVSWATQ